MLQSPSLLEKFFGYLVRPTHQEEIPNNYFWRKLWDTFRLFNFSMIFVIIGSIITTIILTQLDFEVENEVSNLATELNIWIFVFLAVIYAPLTEEVAFRLWLKAKPWSLAFGFSFLINTAISIFSSYNLIPLGQLLDDFYVNILDALEISIASDGITELGRILFGLGFSLFLLDAITIWMYILFKQVPTITNGIKKFYNKYFGLVFYFSAITFGLIHIGNYAGIEEMLWLGPFLVLPQLFAGVELGYIRVQWGVWWSIFAHALNNALPSLLFVSFTFFSDPVRDQMLSGDTSEANIAELYTAGDNVVLLLILLGFLVVILINLSVNIFNLVELIVSLLNKNKAKPQQGQAPTNP